MRKILFTVLLFMLTLSIQAATVHKALKEVCQDVSIVLLVKVDKISEKRLKDKYDTTYKVSILKVIHGDFKERNASFVRYFMIKESGFIKSTHSVLELEEGEEYLFCLKTIEKDGDRLSFLRAELPSKAKTINAYIEARKKREQEKTP